jgi:phosphohistidine phosphatase SixA
VDVIFVRHGARNEDDAGGDLSPHGQHQVVALAPRNDEPREHRRLRPDSRSYHARQSADLLRTELGIDAVPQYELDSLTPHHGPGDIGTLVEEATATGADLRNRQGVVVGHEGRLSDLVAELTAARARPLGHGEAVCVRRRLPGLADRRQRQSGVSLPGVRPSGRPTAVQGAVEDDGVDVPRRIRVHRAQRSSAAHPVRWTVEHVVAVVTGAYRQRAWRCAAVTDALLSARRSREF